ncbi:hypothetical protein VTL71DRAFT_16482 [Oculimacula yallundae]|uniref:Fungal N-terminal domain-containing protein n=1 Tax=Oculimacula yallundae TaxID=86028 RepID=A0ABR4CEK1_9HELO
MAEALGHVATSIALSSVVLQCQESVYKLQQDLQRIKDAPEELSQLSTTLRVTSVVLSKLAENWHRSGISYSLKELTLFIKETQAWLESMDNSIEEYKDSRKRVRSQTAEETVKQAAFSSECLLKIRIAGKNAESRLKRSNFNSATVWQEENERTQPELEGILEKCKILRIQADKVSEATSQFREARLEVERLLWALINLTMLLQSASSVPTTDYMPALNITEEALDWAIASLAVLISSIDVGRTPTLWLTPKVHYRAGQVLKRMEVARAAIVAAQLAVAVRSECRENFAIVAISKNLNTLPLRDSAALRSAFRDQVGAAKAVVNLKRRSKMIKKSYNICWTWRLTVCRRALYSPRGNDSLTWENTESQKAQHYRILPAKWLQKWRLFSFVVDVMFRKGSPREGVEVRTGPTTPASSPSMAACKELDTESLMRCFHNGTGTPFDVDDRGRGMMDLALSTIIQESAHGRLFHESAQSHSKFMRSLAITGASYGFDSRLVIEFASQTGIGLPVELKTTENHWTGLLPGWFLLETMALGLEIIWEQQDEVVWENDIEVDWWYYVCYEIGDDEVELEEKSAKQILFGIWNGDSLRNSQHAPVEPDDNEEAYKWQMEINHVHAAPHMKHEADPRDQYHYSMDDFWSEHEQLPGAFPSALHLGSQAPVQEIISSYEAPSVGSAAEATELSCDEITVDDSMFDQNEGKSIPSSTNGTSIAAQMKSATSELIDLLEKHLRPLQDIIPETLSMDITLFEIKVEEIMRAYGKLLDNEASSPREVAIVQLVLRQSQFVSAAIVRRIYPHMYVESLNLHALEDQSTMSVDEKLARLFKSFEGNEPAPQPEVIRNMQPDEEEDPDLSFVTTVRDQQVFLVHSKAFKTLEKDFRALFGQDTHHDDASTSFARVGVERLIRTFRICLAAINYLVKLSLRPSIPKGHRRLEWKCECGDDLYADFDNSDRASIERLVEQLSSLRDPNTTRIRPTFEKQDSVLNSSVLPTLSPGPPETGGTATLTPFDISVIPLNDVDRGTPITDIPADSDSFSPTTTHPHQSVSIDGNRIPVENQGKPQLLPVSASISQAGGSNINQVLAEQAIPLNQIKFLRLPARSSQENMRNKIPLYVEICVKHKQYTSRHKEITVDMAENDAQFFQKINKAYCEIRRPRWTRLLRPIRIEHVKFSVQNMGAVVGIYDYAGPQIPPEAEVKNGNYHYNPCPWAGEPVPSNIILHELTSSKSQLHTSRTWSEKLPKKCAVSIYSISNPDRAAIGYGIHIIEGYNDMFVSIALLLSVTIAVSAAGLWWAKIRPGDIQGATGLGTLILTVVAALILSYQGFLSL